VNGAPTLRALSLGAGVQSTALALMAVEGVLPLPDVAIFSDTGWEPAKVYRQVARIAEVLTAAGVDYLRRGR
jgi:3'-phosphoadenosine 5'-phosphosulfate sulfotransferase (PAPS reductase)/FAD synthetase